MSDFTDFSSFLPQQLNAPINRNLVKFVVDNNTIDPVKTAEMGYPCRIETVLAHIKVPGSRDEAVTKITPAFLKEYGDLYERWQKNRTEQPVDGLALELWPPIPGTLVEDLKYFNIRTVQNLASIDDDRAMKYHLIDWRKKAQVWLEMAKDGAASQKLAQENTDLKREVERLSRQVTELATQAEKQATEKPPIDLADIAAQVAKLMERANGSGA